MNIKNENKKEIMEDIYNRLNEANKDILILLAKTVKVTQESIKGQEPKKTA